MNKKDLMKVGVGVGVLALLYFAFKKKGTTTKTTSANKSDDSTIKTTKVEGGSISIDEKEFLDNVKRKTQVKAGDSPKTIAIKKFSEEVFTNPPKSEQDFLARASKAGLSKADLQSPEAQKMLNPFSNFVGNDGSKRRESLRRQFGLSLDDDKKLTRVIKITSGILNRDGITDPQEREAIIDDRLKINAKNQNLNLRAFYSVEAGMQAASSQLIQRKRSFSNFDSVLSEERTSGSNSRIKPTSVSGLVVAKRPRNYGTAQRPTRKLTPISVRIAEGMDFDGNEDALGNVM
jgi:hypothetical protein